MTPTFRRLILVFAVAVLCGAAQEARTFKVFQFPADRIPRIDGDVSDWDIVPTDYVVGTDQLTDDTGKHQGIDRKTLDIKVRVGWVKGLNRLYFLYEAFDDYWDFSRTDLRNDTFEVVVDGDRSGGPLIESFHPLRDMDYWDKHFSVHGVQAQNYHIFTPAEGKDWALVWGCQPWIKDLPWANASYSYNFKPGEPGRLVLEFWITPFDYAGCQGPSRAVESVLTEDKMIGLSWAVIDYDNVNTTENNGFWNLSRGHTMYGDASQALAFRLMPLEPAFRKKIDAQWSFHVLDMKRRLIAFADESTGRITSWKWDFGDGTSSSEQHPQHSFGKAGYYVVTLYVEGPDGRSRRSKVWDVTVR